MKWRKCFIIPTVSSTEQISATFLISSFASMSQCVCTPQFRLYVVYRTRNMKFKEEPSLQVYKLRQYIKQICHGNMFQKWEYKVKEHLGRVLNSSCVLAQLLELNQMFLCVKKVKKLTIWKQYLTAWYQKKIIKAIDDWRWLIILTQVLFCMSTSSLFIVTLTFGKIQRWVRIKMQSRASHKSLGTVAYQ